MHTDFILSDIADILDDAIMATSSLESNLPNYPLCDYLLQSLYLRLTGYQEQKLKCILWTLATDNLTFRYQYLNGGLAVGECSSIEDKDKVFSKLKTIMLERGFEFPSPSEAEINGSIQRIKDSLKKKFTQSLFARWRPRDYTRFEEFCNSVSYQNGGYFNSSRTIFGSQNILKDAYIKAYEHRNRCAHNLLSYQDNAPVLSDFAKDVRGTDNYFTRVFLIFLIDDVFVKLFRHYIQNRRRWI